jgi:hypothetical protein
MSIVLLVLYVAIALWIYVGMGLREMYGDIHSGAKVSSRPKFRKRLKRFQLAFGVSSAVILTALIVLLLNTY